MEITWTATQKQRLKEMGCTFPETIFSNTNDRDVEYSKLISNMEKDCAKKIRLMSEHPQRHDLAQLESDLSELLIGMGFMEFKTPTIISKAALAKMTITEKHPLYRQVFFIDDKRCLRPMLAPNLYNVMSNLRKSIVGPIKFFEIGSCFRKESHSTNHLEEFTMLNLVELGPEGEPSENLRGYIGAIMDKIGVKYELTHEFSDVYKETLDVEVEGKELASGAVGPHTLDKAHGINEPWCGVGFGLERLLSLRNGTESIRKVSRSLVYVNSVRMDL